MSECYCQEMDETELGAHLTEDVESLWLLGRDGESGDAVLRVLHGDEEAGILYIDCCPFCGRALN